MPNLAHTILYRLLALLATCFIICRYNVLYSTHPFSQLWHCDCCSFDFSLGRFIVQVDGQ